MSEYSSENYYSNIEQTKKAYMAVRKLASRQENITGSQWGDAQYALIAGYPIDTQNQIKRTVEIEELLEERRKKRRFSFLHPRSSRVLNSELITGCLIRQGFEDNPIINLLPKKALSAVNLEQSVVTPQKKEEYDWRTARRRRSLADTRFFLAYSLLTVWSVANLFEFYRYSNDVQTMLLNSPEYRAHTDLARLENTIINSYTNLTAKTETVLVNQSDTWRSVEKKTFANPRLAKELINNSISQLESLDIPTKNLKESIVELPDNTSIYQNFPKQQERIAEVGHEVKKHEIAALKAIPADIKDKQSEQTTLNLSVILSFFSSIFGAGIYAYRKMTTLYSGF